MFSKDGDGQKRYFSFFDRDTLLDGNAVAAFVNDSSCGNLGNKIFTSNGNYFTCETKDGMQIWCQLNPEDENNITEYNLHYKTSTRTRVVLDGWTSQSENHMSALAHVWNKNTDIEFPMNLQVMNAGMLADYESGEFTVQIAAFAAQDITLYADGNEYAEAEGAPASESFIPVGTFPSGEDASDWEPTSHAVLSGKIERVSRCVNPYSGDMYYQLLVYCMGLKLDVPLDARTVENEPREGGYIHGLFYLTARFFLSSNDELLTPLFSIDTGRIIEDWKKVKLDKDYEDPTEGWELLAYPVMPDKSILVIFQNSARADSENPEKSVYYYRFLHFDENGRIIEGRRTYTEGEVIHTAYYDSQGHFHIVYSAIGDETSYVYDPDDGLEVHHAHPLGENISRLITDSSGNIFVGRDFSPYLEWTDNLIAIYGSDAEKITEDIDDGYRCAELTLDEGENVWCYMEPVATLNKISPEEDGFAYCEREKFPLSRVLGMAVSQDGNTIFCECEGTTGRSRFYLVSVNPERFGEPEEVKLPITIHERCDTYGMCSTAKDRILFNTDGVLYLLKLENKKCGTPADLAKVKVRRRDLGEPRVYVINIDPSAPVNVECFDYYVKPVIENMEDLYGEFLTIAYTETRAGDLVNFIQVTKDGDAYHMELGIAEKGISTPVRLYALPMTDFDTVYDAFKTVIVDKRCPDVTGWEDYTQKVFGEEQP